MSKARLALSPSWKIPRCRRRTWPTSSWSFARLLDRAQTRLWNVRSRGCRSAARAAGDRHEGPESGNVRSARSPMRSSRSPKKYKGLLWGEHGKGVRSEYSPEFFGPLYPSSATDQGRVRPAQPVEPRQDLHCAGERRISAENRWRSDPRPARPADSRARSAKTMPPPCSAMATARASTSIHTIRCALLGRARVNASIPRRGALR